MGGADKAEEKKKESKTTNLRKKLSFKKSFSFLRKKAAKEAKKDEEEKKEGEAEKKEGEEAVAAETTEENKEETKVEEVEKKDEEKEVKDTEEKAPEVPTEAPPAIPDSVEEVKTEEKSDDAVADVTEKSRTLLSQKNKISTPFKVVT